MLRLFSFSLVLLFISLAAAAQDVQVLRVKVVVHDSGAPMANAAVSVKGTDISATTAADGRATLPNIPTGEHMVVVSSAGYQTKEVKIVFPLSNDDEQEIELDPLSELASVTIESTRTGRTIEAEPTRVEAIDEEEVEEKINMRPANVSMVLNESTGIKVQQTSATSATQSIRIQGLDGRYTQILKDGFPSYGGFAGSQSLLEIPPIDLRQVEIIKGPAATFYGEGAIAGVVNFISKVPGEESESILLLNQTSALGTDLSFFNTRRAGRFGHTFLGQFNYQNEYDADDDGFSDLPRTYSFAVTPRAFFYIDDATRLTIGNSTTYQNRNGGDMKVIRGTTGPQNRYFEKNRSVRNITTVNFSRDLSGNRRFTAKQSVAFFDRELTTPDHRFAGRQFNSYTDLSLVAPIKNHAVIVGFTAAFDRFNETDAAPGEVERDESRASFGAFIQDTVDISDRLSLETGLRVDGTRKYGTFALPRVSLLYRFTDDLTTRIGFGLGYKTPTIFNEDSETILFRGVLPIEDGTKAERSRGGTFDINYRAEIAEKIGVSINQMFFYTQITDPIVLEDRPNGRFAFGNADSSVISRGFETNIRADYKIAKLFLGYTYTNAKAGYLSDTRVLPLTPRNKINSSLILEEHDNFKAGIEAHFTGRQTLSDRTSARSYTVVGIFGEKMFKKFSLFINAENITDVRQSRYGQVVFPPLTAPTFSEVYTHLEGRVFNGGIKIRF
ncbi:MAG: TonB-dependent receptor [Acidobacteria bacterium]|nr:TonB-dependent receptor [Acidobacteriota bacterium]